MPPRQELLDRSESRQPGEDNLYMIGTVYADYYLPMKDRRVYLQKEMYIRYIKPDGMQEDVNRYVLADTVIQKHAACPAGDQHPGKQKL